LCPRDPGTRHTCDNTKPENWNSHINPRYVTPVTWPARELNTYSFLGSKINYLTAMREYPWNSRTGAIRERRCIAAGTLEQLPGNRAKNWVLVRAYWREHLAMIIEPTLARDTGRGPRDKPSMRVTGRRTSKRQPKKPGVSVIGDIEGQNFDFLQGWRRRPRLASAVLPRFLCV